MDFFGNWTGFKWSSGWLVVNQIHEFFDSKVLNLKKPFFHGLSFQKPIAGWLTGCVCVPNNSRILRREQSNMCCSPRIPITVADDQNKFWFALRHFVGFNLEFAKKFVRKFAKQKVTLSQSLWVIFRKLTILNRTLGLFVAGQFDYKLSRFGTLQNRVEQSHKLTFRKSFRVTIINLETVLSATFCF